jgi:hypothetical protein
MKTIKTADGKQLLRVDNATAEKLVATGEYRYSTKGRWYRALKENARVARLEYSKMVRQRRLAKLKKKIDAMKAMQKSTTPTLAPDPTINIPQLTSRTFSVEKKAEPAFEQKLVEKNSRLKTYVQKIRRMLRFK